MCDLWSLLIQKNERFKTLAVFGQKTGFGGHTEMLEVSTDAERRGGRAGGLAEGTLCSLVDLGAENRLPGEGPAYYHTAWK